MSAYRGSTSAGTNAFLPWEHERWGGVGLPARPLRARRSLRGGRSWLGRCALPWCCRCSTPQAPVSKSIEKSKSDLHGIPVSNSQGARPCPRRQGRGALGAPSAKGAVGLGVAHCRGVVGVAPLRKPLHQKRKKDFFYWKPAGPNALHHRHDFSRPGV